MAKKSRRGGASAPKHCKAAFKKAIKAGEPLSPSVSRTAMKAFNKCRSKRKRK